MTTTMTMPENSNDISLSTQNEVIITELKVDRVKDDVDEHDHPDVEHDNEDSNQKHIDNEDTTDLPLHEHFADTLAIAPTIAQPPTQPDHIHIAWEWYRRLGSPKYWVAPLVGLSDKSFRILCRRYGATMAHVEMTDPGGFVRSTYYRTQMIGKQIDNDQNLDRPLILQLGSSNIDKLQQAIQLAFAEYSHIIDAIELNCGCPQKCAASSKKQSCYGSFLLDPDNQSLLLDILPAMRKVIPSNIPLLVKIRVLKSISDTVVLAQKIVNAGAGILTVHGRTRFQGGGSKTSGEHRLASWPHIKAVKQAVNVPVIANGNVPNKHAVQKILQFTGCDGVMSGCGILHDPTLFDGKIENDSNIDRDTKWNRAVQISTEYIDLAIQYETHPTRVSKHLTWILDEHGFRSRAPGVRHEVIELRRGFDKEDLENYYTTNNNNIASNCDDIQTSNNNNDGVDKNDGDFEGIAGTLTKIKHDLQLTMTEKTTTSSSDLV